MPGGTFIKGVEKTRPGFYVNFENVAPTKVSLSERGTLVMPILSPKYGPLKQFISISNTDSEGQFSKLGYKLIDEEMLLINEAMKSAKEVILYLAGNGGTKASITTSPLTVTAKYVGTRGNDLQVTIVDSVTSGKNVVILLGTTKIYDEDGVTNVEDLSESAWVDFTGTGVLVNTTAINLAGGSDAATANEDVTDFLAAAETQEFNAIAITTDEAALLTAFDTKVKYFNEDIGKYCQGVRAKGTVNADSEYITTLKNGVELATGVKLTAKQAAAWYGAATAAAPITVDLTNVSYPGAVDANPRLTHVQTTNALKSGEIVFTLTGEKVVVEEDINSLTTYTVARSEAYSDNRVIRTLQEIAKTGKVILPPNKYNNDKDGQQLAKQDLISILTLMENMHALKNVDVDNDVQIDTAASTGKSFVASVAAQPVRTYKKYYITVQTS